MKTKVVIIVIASVLVSALRVTAQEHNNPYIFKYQGKHKMYQVGAYADLGVSFGDKLEKSSFYLDGRIGLVWNQHWAVGFAGSALNYDHRLDELVSEGTYRLEAGYSGLFVEYIFDLTGWARMSASITSGRGLALYRYHKEYAESYQWYEEIIDQETFAVFQPAAELQINLGRHWWIAVRASYRNTSPIKLMGQKDCFMQGVNYGFALKYNLY